MLLPWIAANQVDNNHPMDVYFSNSWISNIVGKLGLIMCPRTVTFWGILFKLERLQKSYNKFNSIFNNKF